MQETITITIEQLEKVFKDYDRLSKKAEECARKEGDFTYILDMLRGMEYVLDAMGFSELLNEHVASTK